MINIRRWRACGLALTCLSLSLSFGLLALQPVQGKVAAPSQSGPASFGAGYPSSMAATGDSISQAANSTGLGDNPTNSWSTGDNSAVQSHYRRLLGLNPAISGQNFNDSVSGSVMAGLNSQLSTAAGQGVEYVSVLMGANDICNVGNLNAVTPLATFTSQFRTALTTFSLGDSDARIFVSSIPDLQKLWEVLHTNPTAQGVWDNYNICPLMLSSSGSAQQRAAVEQILVGYNAALGNVCVEFVHCRFDSNTTFNTAIAPSDASSLDYYHPSLAGQTKLAAGTWAVTFDFNDTTAPVSKASLSSNFNTGNLTATLNASDNVGLSGIEYRLDGGSWTRYTAPLGLSSTNSSLVYRAVDVNGNNEVPHTVWVVGNGAASGGSGQTLSAALSSAKAGDTVGFALSGASPTVQISSPLNVPAGVSVIGGSCSGPFIRSSGSAPSTFTLGGSNFLSGLRLGGFRLVAGPEGGNRLSCVSISSAPG